MQRDMKIGMALGVALVGIVGALFFRREPEVKLPAPPALEDAAGLDRQIADKSRTPYLQGVDEFPDGPPAPPIVPAKKPVGAAPPTKSEAYQPPGFLTREDEAEHRAFVAGQPLPAPDPIAAPAAQAARKPEPTARDLSTSAPPAHNRDWQPIPGAPASRRPPASTPDGAKSHVIQPGDTLSGLAQRYWGTSARFREIYEANRHVLRSPDDLPEGTTIFIPALGQESSPPNAGKIAGAGPAPSSLRQTPARPTSTAAPSSSAVSTHPSVSGDSGPGALRFAPVRRSPLSAGRAAEAPRSGAAARAGEPLRPRIEFGDDPFAEP
ncbi:MAG: LysM peptidoglycan-binding domain-containing protein [Planctomycetaceae bacterium]